MSQNLAEKMTPKKYPHSLFQIQEMLWFVCTQFRSQVSFSIRKPKQSGKTGNEVNVHLQAPGKPV